MDILISWIYSKNTNKFCHNDILIQTQYWADKVKIINKHKHNKAYCINIKIEDHILKYRVYPKQYQSWYQLEDFQLHPISKDKTSVRKQNQHQNISQVCLSSVTPSPISQKFLTYIILSVFRFSFPINATCNIVGFL